MKNFRAILFAIALIPATTLAGDAPQRVSIAPGNDLSAIAWKPPRGGGSGVFVCFGAAKDSVPPTEKCLEGYRAASLNVFHGKRNLLVIDDGKTVHPATDKDTGLPVIILANAKVDRELLDLVEGYNASMRFDNERRKKR